MMKKIISTFLIAVCLMSPIVSFAQATSTQTTTGNQTGQAGTGSTGGSSGDAAASAAGSAAGCAVGAVLGTYLKGLVSDAISSVSSSQVPVNETQLRQKETMWDDIGYCIINGIISYIAQSTINWINSGFEGSPVFVENPEQFFKDIADQEAGALIQELGLGFMCSNFRPQLQLAVLDQHVGRNNFQQQSSCTLSQSINNVEQFLGGDFSQGGWRGWIELTQVPQNNPYGAYQMAQNELQKRIDTAKEENELQLQWGNGYLSFKDCEVDPDTQKKTNCRTTTPGQVVSSQISQRFQLPNDRLVAADEFNEIVTALVDQLIKIAINESLGNN